jgi:PadR family transcriptional regulator, regulatory protein PadR
MKRSRRPSRQTLDVLASLAAVAPDWLYGLEIVARTGLKSGSLYPILMRLAERGLLESQWTDPSAPGRPPRHAYRILPAGRRVLEEFAKPRRQPAARRAPA